MIHKYVYIMIIAGSVLLTGGCKKFLNERAEDEYTDEQVFSTPLGIQQALNGLYTGLASDDLYGSKLTMEAVDIIGHRYNTDEFNEPTYIDIAQNYSAQGKSGSTFDLIWSNAYALVLKTNNFITQTEKARDQGVVSNAQASILLGEAKGIRALVEFDLLRLYGPQRLAPEDDLKPAIPYNTTTDSKVHAILSFGDVVGKVLEDCAAAASLLANDPIITSGVLLDTKNIDYYNSLRNRRMNFYAVQALTARVYLYAGKKEEAHAAAKAVIEAVDNVFPWTDYSAIVGVADPDRIFSSEVIFGVYNPDLYNLQTKYFNASLFPYQMLVPSSDQLETVFEGNENDYRYTTTWLNGNNGFRTFFKYADLSDPLKSWRFFQPLIRKSELYYILAETDPDPEQGVQYLNTVRLNRGLTDLDPDAQLSDEGGEIEKEYLKEFYGEGQVFFYYKRINPYWMYDISSYQVPLPVSETQLR